MVKPINLINPINPINLINPIIPMIGIAILSSIQILLIYRISSILINKNTALFSSLLLSVFPEHILLNNLIGSDVLFSTFCYLSIYFICQSYQKKNIITIFLAGLFFGLCILF